VTAAAALLHALLGGVYCLLAGLAALDLRQPLGRRTRRFVLAFAAMVGSCGLHHLTMAWATATGDHPGTPAMLLSLLLGLVPGLAFAGLRLEAVLGGRGDRFLPGQPAAVALLAPVGFTSLGLVTGVAVTTSVAEHAGYHRDGTLLGQATAPLAGWLAGHAPEQVATAALNAGSLAVYAAVAVLLLRTQLNRRTLLGGWSLSGLSLGLVFASCALMHLVAALEHAHGTAHTLVVDLLLVPAGLAFLAVVRDEHRLSQRVVAPADAPGPVGATG